MQHIHSHRWCAWLAAAGVAGVAANLVFTPSLTEAERSQSLPEVVALLDAGAYHLAAVAGFLACAFLIVAAAGWLRFARSLPASLAALIVPVGLVATAGAGVISYGIKGMLAIYLPGGMNEGLYAEGGLEVLVALDDLLPFLTWWGGGVAVLAVAWLALVERALPRWIGALGVLAMLPPVGLLLAFGFTGMTGITVPLWMVVAGVGLALRRPTPVRADSNDRPGAQIGAPVV